MGWSNRDMLAGSRQQMELAKRRAKDQADNEQRAKEHSDFTARQDSTYQTRPGMQLSEQSKYERAAGVDPASYEGTRDIKTGELLSGYKINPYSGEAQQALKEQAFSQGDSPWARMQLQKQGLEQTQALDNSAKTQAQMMSQAQGDLMRTGGISDAARARMATQGSNAAALAQQNVYRQGQSDRLNIQGQDIGRKEGLLKDFANAETGANTQNLGTATNDMSQKAMFDMERYKQQMQAWGADKTADAQKNASKGGKK